MAAVATINVSGSITGTPGGSQQLAFTVTGVVFGLLTPTLASGANTITVPVAGTSGCIIILPGSGGAATTLKGVTGDTGVPLGSTGKHLVNWGAGNAPATFCLTSASLQTGVTYIYFF